MTPLATRFVTDHQAQVSESLRSISRASYFTACKFFDLRAIPAQTVVEEARRITRGEVPGPTFLPCNGGTWCELMADYTDTGLLHMALNLRLIGNDPDSPKIALDYAVLPPSGWTPRNRLVHVGTGSLDEGNIAFQSSEEFTTAMRRDPTWKEDTTVMIVGQLLSLSLACVNIINTPSRHERAERRMSFTDSRKVGKALHAAGSYALRPWTEITLVHPAPPPPPPAEEGYSGRKCQHGVRSHERRYRDGRVVVIREHLRGDPALGIKQSRYIVKPSEENPAP